jgi:hypothetical protein
LAACPFTDGAGRDVYEDADGRQYVLDGAQWVYGVWLPPADEPVVVSVSADHPADR